MRDKEIADTKDILSVVAKTNNMSLSKVETIYKAALKYVDSGRMNPDIYAFLLPNLGWIYISKKGMWLKGAIRMREDNKRKKETEISFAKIEQVRKWYRADKLVKLIRQRFIPSHLKRPLITTKVWGGEKTIPEIEEIQNSIN